MQINVRELALRQLNFRKDKLFGEGVGARLPEAYKKFYKEWMETKPKPVHYVPVPGTYQKHEKTGLVTPVQNVPLQERKSKDYENVMAGGELIIQGFIKKSVSKRRVPRFWVPNIKRSVVYSEILNQYMSVLMTERLIEKIHEHHGLDHYILGSKACDLNTIISIKLKRKLLFALKDKDLPYDESQRLEIYEKYKDYLLPDEEVEWYGLTYYEALRKQEEIEKKMELEAIIPLKHKYRMELLERLEKQSSDNSQEVGSGWLSKIKNPFTSKTTS